MAELLIRPLAESDLLEIWSYTAQFSEESADQLIAQFDQKFQLLSQTPHIGRFRPEIQVENLKSLPCKNHVIYYISTDEVVEIVRILHARRDVGQLISESES